MPWTQKQHTEYRKEWLARQPPEKQEQMREENKERCKKWHAEHPEMLPKFLEEKTTSALTGINKHMMEQILAFARAGHHQRVYVVVEFTYTDKPGAVTWNQHLFGYGDRGVAFKLAKKLHETVQIYDFGAPL